MNSEKLVLNFQSETPLKLQRSSDDTEYSFGVDDSKLEIHVPEGCEANYIEEWRYALAGYADLDAVKQAVINDLTGEDGTLPAENRIRVMMGLDPKEEKKETDTLGEELSGNEIPNVEEEAEETQETEETDDSISFEIPAEDETVSDPEQDNSEDEEPEAETDVEGSVENEEEIQE